MPLFEVEEKLSPSAEIAMRDVLGLKKGEKVLIITNPIEDVSAISIALYKATLKLGGKAVLIYQEKKSQLDFAEDPVLGAIEKEPEIVISMSAGKLGKDRFALEKPYTAGEKKYDHIFTYLLRGKKKIRAFWSPGVTKDIFARTVPIDYSRLKKEAVALKNILDMAEGVRIRAAGGTKLYIGLKDRETHLDHGDFTAAGTGGNLPCGEVFISPQLKSSEGIIVFDGSLSLYHGDIVLKEPVRCKVEKGFVNEIRGGEEAEKLKETIQLAKKNAEKMAEEGKFSEKDKEEYIKNATNLGELGIGLNPKAKITGNMLEDEKAYHTCHIAIGSNYDEDAKSLIHLDGLIKKPTIVAVMPDGEEKVLMKEGKLLI
ncbi:MAG TPA: peptidase M17 [Thermoplasmata archaeon]|nr:peptidase M17 [Thermoplasmata archaeon]